jgi:hypothetical protein
LRQQSFDGFYSSTPHISSSATQLLYFLFVVVDQEQKEDEKIKLSSNSVSKHRNGPARHCYRNNNDVKHKNKHEPS